MTPEQIILVQTSYGYIVPSAERVVAAFYERLFEIDPTLRPVFPANIGVQTHKFVTMLDLMVADMDRMDSLIPAIEALGVRHAGYGVTRSHYASVGRALLGAFEEELGSMWTAELQAAWTGAYTLISTLMQAAAAEVAYPAS